MTLKMNINKSLTRAAHCTRTMKTRHWLLFICLATILLFKYVPSLGYFYTRCIYPVVGGLLTPISSVLPVAIGDLFIAASVAWVVVYPAYSILLRKRKKWATMTRVAEFLAWIYVWFYAAWGLNYSQPSIYERIGFAPVEVSATTFRTFAYAYVDSLNATYPEGTLAACATGVTNGYKKAVEEAVFHGYTCIDTTAGRSIGKPVHMGINAPFCRRAKAKTMVFSRLSTMAGVTGSMSPFFGEFTLNADLQPHEYASVYAHEYAHLLGVANEGEANFYSFLVCTSARDRSMRFSGYYHIFFYMLHNVRTLLGDDEYMRFTKRVRPEILRLAEHDSDYWLSRRSRLVDATQDFFYNLYLRGNKVEGGTKSYSGVTAIIMAWEAVACGN